MNLEKGIWEAQMKNSITIVKIWVEEKLFQSVIIIESPTWPYRLLRMFEVNSLGKNYDKFEKRIDLQQVPYNYASPKWDGTRCQEE